MHVIARQYPNRQGRRNNVWHPISDLVTTASRAACIPVTPVANRCKLTAAVGHPVWNARVLSTTSGDTIRPPGQPSKTQPQTIKVNGCGQFPEYNELGSEKQAEMASKSTGPGFQSAANAKIRLPRIRPVSFDLVGLERYGLAVPRASWMVESKRHGWFDQSTANIAGIDRRRTRTCQILLLSRDLD